MDDILAGVRASRRLQNLNNQVYGTHTVDWSMDQSGCSSSQSSSDRNVDSTSTRTVTTTKSPGLLDRIGNLFNGGKKEDKEPEMSIAE